MTVEFDQRLGFAGPPSVECPIGLQETKPQVQSHCAWKWDYGREYLPPLSSIVSYPCLPMRCCSGGQLDIDMNTGASKSTEPIENIFFDEPEHGKYATPTLMPSLDMIADRPIHALARLHRYVVSVLAFDDEWTVGLKVMGKFYVLDGSRMGTVCSFVWMGGDDVESIELGPNVKMESL